MPDLVTQNLLTTLGQTAYSLYDNPTTRRYREELRAIGRGFRQLVHGRSLDEETLAAVQAVHVEHPDQTIALCRAYQRIVSFNFDPAWNDDSNFDASGQRHWPADGSEWNSWREGNDETH